MKMIGQVVYFESESGQSLNRWSVDRGIDIKQNGDNVLLQLYKSLDIKHSKY